MSDAPFLELVEALPQMTWEDLTGPSRKLTTYRGMGAGWLVTVTALVSREHGARGSLLCTDYFGVFDHEATATTGQLPRDISERVYAVAREYLKVRTT